MTPRKPPAVPGRKVRPGTEEPRPDAFDVERVRAEFPVLGRTVYGKPLVYLDSAATAQKPRAVIDALARFYLEDNANIHRGVHYLSERATTAYEGCRDQVRAFLGARETCEIVFTHGTTESINLVASAWGRQNLGPGDEVLITGLEHHSNIVPWQLVCEATGATLKVVPITDAGEVRLKDFEQGLTARTRLVAVSHMSNALGTINPVREMTALAHARGVPILVDGAQAVAHLPVDVAALGCDFYAFSAHKIYGPTGIGVLYGRRDRLEAMSPYQGGGDMIESVTFARTTYAPLPGKFEAGTPNISGAIGLGEALRFVARIGLEAIARHEAELLEYATREVAAIDGVRLVGTAPHKAGILSFVLAGVHPHDIGTILDLEGVAIRVGHHCAQPIMDRFGLAATARASFAVYNTREDVDALVRAIHKVKEVFK
ncbi:MAG: cysteine desulfurase [Planctomycetes bacterium]|nr:cysteine desulfurase [Planctomycetota bacterium]